MSRIELGFFFIYYLLPFVSLLNRTDCLVDRLIGRQTTDLSIVCPLDLAKIFVVFFKLKDCVFESV